MFQFFTKLDYLLRETFRGLRRGGWMNWAAVSTVTVLLFLMGVSLQASWQLEGLLTQFGSQLEVSVFLDTGIQATDMQPAVAQLPDVVSVAAVTKEEAWSGLVRELGISDIQGATAQLEGNPLVDELKVKARSSEAVPRLAETLRGLRGVESVQYGDEAVQRVAELHDGLTWVSVTVITLLTFTAIAVITTTIRLIVMARRREIEVLQLVGATMRWIYLPFILQGVLFGTSGAVLAWIMLTALRHFAEKLLVSQPQFVQFLAEGLQLSPYRLVLLPLVLLGFGSSVGVLGSLFAVRRMALK